MSISSKLLFLVPYNSNKADTCYSAVFSCYVLRVSHVNSFLYLNINYILFDDILSGEKNYSDIIMSCLLSSQLSDVLSTTNNFIANKLAMFIDPSSQQQYWYFWSTLNFSTF